MSDKAKTFNMYGRFHYVHRDPLGYVLEENTFMNQIQDNMLSAAIDGIATGTCSSIAAATGSMAIGTGTGADEDENTLNMGASATSASGVNVAVDASTVSVRYTSTFTGRGSWSIEEAGLFTDNTLAHMMAYNDSISVSMTNDDTLQITWDIIADQA